MLWQDIPHLLKYIITFAILNALQRVLIKYYKWYTHPIWKNSKIGGPDKKPFTSSFWLGQFRDATKEPFMKRELRWFNEATQSGYFPDHIHLCMMNGRHSILTREADFIHEILCNKQNQFPRADTPFIQNLLGKGLLTLDYGEDWKRHKRIIQPCFQMKLLRDLLSQVVPPVVKELTECWSHAGEGAEIDIAQHLSYCTLDILGVAAFQHEFKAMDLIRKWSEQRKNANADDTGTTTVDPLSDPLMNGIAVMFKTVIRSMILALFGLSFLDRSAKYGKAAITHAVDEIIGKARTVRQATSSSQSNSDITQEQDKKSLLEVLLGSMDSESHKRKRLNHEELRDEVKTFLLAGHATTATWCLWCCFVLCQYPSIQEKLYNDIMKYAPKPSSNSHTCPIDLETIDKMTYFNAFLQEVLRFYPPVAGMIRGNKKDHSFNDLTIPADTRLIISIFLLHRNPTYWKTHNPDEFHPERWLGEEHPATIPHAFIPFSGGARYCIGHMFATFETKLIMVDLIRSFQFYGSPSQRNIEFTIKSRITTSPEPDAMVCVRRRT